jgi:ubiquinone/menaquinone biosynthesis C-methylase UbiE
MGPVSADRNPQAEQMADESMVRTLAAQAEAIWPQERPLVERYALPRAARVLDVACGTGEWSARVLEALPGATLVGIDVEAPHLERARARNAAYGERARFQTGDAYALPFPDASFDLVACRHLVQAIPRAERVIAELARVCTPGGVVHAITEDYGMMHFSGGQLDADAFWRHGPRAFGEALGIDLHVGRRGPVLLAAAGLREVRVDYVVVDTLRVPRQTFADIWRAWRDGYVATIGEHTSFRADEARAYFDDMIRTIEAPGAYAVWQVPVVSGRRHA